MPNCIFKKISKLVLLCAVIICSVIAGQFAQFLYSVSDLRADSMAEWAGDDIERQSTVQAFTQQCLVGAKPQAENSITAPISIEKCAKTNGFEELASVAESSDQVLKSYAWPLSLIADQKL